MKESNGVIIHRCLSQHNSNGSLLKLENNWFTLYGRHFTLGSQRTIYRLIKCVLPFKDIHNFALQGQYFCSQMLCCPSEQDFRNSAGGGRRQLFHVHTCTKCIQVHCTSCSTFESSNNNTNNVLVHIIITSKDCTESIICILECISC